MIRFRRIRLWWFRQHDRYRIPWCWECVLGREAGDEFYVHDEPRWLIRELVEQRAYDCVTAPPEGYDDSCTDPGDESDLTENDFDVLMDRAEPAEIVHPPRTYATGASQTWHWDSTYGLRRLS